MTWINLLHYGLPRGNDGNMQLTDFKHIRNFKPAEIQKDGSILGAVSLALIVSIDDLRDAIKTPISIICVTGGDHGGDTHPRGIAVDFTTKNFIDMETMIWNMCRAGFRGIGIYKNNLGYFSYHGDVRPEPVQMWGAYKKQPQYKWTYVNIQDII